MSGTITHSWNGTVLTITSDSGTSSADLKGDEGVRGPQGPAGVNTTSGGSVTSVNGKVGEVTITADDVGAMPVDTPIPSIAGLATEEYVNQKITEAQISGSDVDLANYYTKTETEQLIDEALENVSPGEADLSNYYTKTETEELIDAALENVGPGEVDLSNYYTKQEVDNLIPTATTVPTNVSAFTNDAGYLNADGVRAIVTEELEVIENGTY